MEFKGEAEGITFYTEPLSLEQIQILFGEEKQVSELKPGDYARLTQDFAGRKAGEHCRVNMYGVETGEYETMVKFPNGELYWVPNSILVKVEEEKFKVGDRVRFYGGSLVVPNGSLGTVVLLVCPGVLDIKFDFNHSVVSCIITAKDYHIQKMETLTGALQRLGAALFPSYEQVSTFTTSGPTSITHEGQVTTTEFADGSEIVTKPSAEDTAKYDPYIGFCVAMTAKLFGSKGAAKEFYTKNVTTKPVVPEYPFKVGDIIRGRKDNGYCLTTDKVIMLVTAVYPRRGEMNARVVSGGNLTGVACDVDNSAKNFELIHRPEEVVVDGTSK